MQIKSAEPFELFAFESEDGRSQIREWLSSIRGTSIQKAVEGCIRRVRRGNLGDVKQFRFASRGRPVLLELRINVRSGPRLYALAAGGRRLVLLSGGTKRRQKTDLMNASALHRACAERRGRIRAL